MFGSSCAKPIVHCPQTPRPTCAPIVREYMVAIAETQPRLKRPSPHEVLDLLECIELLQK